MAEGHQLPEKKAGMSLKDIREYINLAMQATTPSTTPGPFREAEKKSGSPDGGAQHTMDVLNFKCWFYETAKKAGTTLVPQCMEAEEIPEEFQKIREELHCKPECN